MVSFIDAHRGAHGVEPICDGLPIAPSSYYDHRAKRSEPARLSDRVRRDDALRPEIRRVFEENWGVSGVRKVGSFAQRYVKRHAPVREGLKPAVYAGLCPPFPRAISRRFLRGDRQRNSKPSIGHVAPQGQLDVFPKPWNWERRKMNRLSGGKPRETCSSTVS
jgi:hypothetical protein